jgi:hypothetical protein
MVQTRRIIAIMWANDMPTQDARFANVYRAALKAGLNHAQAFALIRDAYNAAKGYTWQLPEGSAIQLHTKMRNAAENPNCKDAEELRAIAEGRESRWDKPEFYSELCAEAAARG